MNTLISGGKASVVIRTRQEYQQCFVESCPSCPFNFVDLLDLRWSRGSCDDCCTGRHHPAERLVIQAVLAQ